MLVPVGKSILRSLARTAPFEWGVRLAGALPQRRGNLLRVLTYHRIDELDARPDLDSNLISSTPAQFAEQVKWLAREFDLVSLSEVLAAVCEHAPLPKRALLLTFDDAYQDFEKHAWPILREHAAPAAVFVPTAFPDCPENSFWWDRLNCALLLSDCHGIATPFGPFALTSAASRNMALRKLKHLLKSLQQADLEQAVQNICQQCNAPTPKPAVLSWTQLRRLAASGVALVPHTHSHPLLDRISTDEARAQMRHSREMLQQQVGEVLSVLAYPSGHFNDEIVQVAQEEEFQLAFTSRRGINDLQTADPLRLRRINVARFKPDALLRWQLTAVAQQWPRANRSVDARQPARVPVADEYQQQPSTRLWQDPEHRDAVNSELLTRP